MFISLAVQTYLEYIRELLARYEFPIYEKNLYFFNDLFDDRIKRVRGKSAWFQDILKSNEDWIVLGMQRTPAVPSEPDTRTSWTTTEVPEADSAEDVYHGYKSKTNFIRYDLTVGWVSNSPDLIEYIEEIYLAEIYDRVAGIDMVIPDFGTFILELIHKEGNDFSSYGHDEGTVSSVFKMQYEVEFKHVVFALPTQHPVIRQINARFRDQKTNLFDTVSYNV
jgi:hypothetical protein